MKLGIYVGSFNPVHSGHLKVINYLLDNNIVDKVLVVPTESYWDKKIITNIQDRINMLKFFENERIIIDDVHNIYPYTYQVIESIKKDYIEAELYLIIGSDNLEKLHLWKNIDQILTNHIIVLRRGYEDINKYLDNHSEDIIIINDFPFIDISSTEIRSNLDNKNLDGRVLKYIKEKKLYERSR